MAVSQGAIGNMAQPQYLEQFKTISGNPFLSEFVDITNEELHIKIHPGFESATYTIKYHIYSAKDGLQIPLLFIASDYASDFTVKIDGKEIFLIPIPKELGSIEGTKFSDFLSIFGKGENNNYSTSEQIDLDFYVTLRDMLYFETDIATGAHTIEISYKASQFISQDGLVKNYSFRYALSPALYWKSFGTLDLTIDASEFEEAIETNVGESNSGSLAGVAQWQFAEMPVEVLNISYSPPINGAAKLLINLGTVNFTYILGFVLFALHLFWMYSYRVKNINAKITFPVVAGSFIVPLFFALSGFIHYYITSIFLGEHAGTLYGSGYFYLALTYPFMIIIYGLLIWFIDLLFKKNINTNTP